MKKILLIMVLAIPIILCGKTITYNVKYNHEDLKIEVVECDSEKFTSITLNGLDNFGENGMPSLPYKTVSFALPYNANDIKISNVKTSLPSEYDLKYDVVPFYARTTSMEYTEYEDEVKESSHYDMLKISHVERYKGINSIVSVCISPVEHIESEKKIKFYEDISFEITYNDGINNPSGGYLTKDYVKSRYYQQDILMLNMLVENPEVVNDISELSDEVLTSLLPNAHQHSSSTIPAYEYTIVTTQELANEFQRLVSLKRIQGLDAGIVNIEEILEDNAYASGDNISNINDDAGKLKAYLMDNRDVIRFVLLGGMPPEIPIRYGYNPTAGNVLWKKMIPSDLYYGSPDSVSWNTNNNEYYGENLNGFEYSSIFRIGRVPCTNADDVKNYLDKLEIFELNPGLGDLSYLVKAYSHFSNFIQPWYVHDAIRAKFGRFDYTVSTNSNLYTGSDIINHINSNNYYFVDLDGHGNPGGISVSITERSPGDTVHYGIDALDGHGATFMPEDGNGLDCLTNFGYPNIFYSIACHTTAFDTYCLDSNGNHFVDNWLYWAIPKGFSQSLINGKNYGAVAYIGNTRIGYSIESPLQEKYFFDYIKGCGIADDIYIGDALNYSKIALKQNTHHLSQCTHICNLSQHLVGDPALKIWNGSRAPKKLNLIDSIVRQMGSVTVTLNRDRDASTKVVFVEPDGNMHTGVFSNSRTVTNPVNQYSQVYVIDNSRLPNIADLEIPGFLSISSSNYLYVNNLTLGTDTEFSENMKLKFIGGVDYIYDVQGDVRLKKNVSIRNASNVTIMTPGICYFEGISVFNGSQLKVYADSVVITNSISSELADGRIVIYGYDKYDRNQNPNVSHLRIKGNNYEPLLEDGKTWRYTYVLSSFYQYPECFEDKSDLKGENLVDLKIKGKTEIDGMEYFNLYYYDAYEGNDPYRFCNDKPFAFIREDVTEGKVWLIPNFEAIQEDNQMALSLIQHLFYVELRGNEGPFLIYDFKDINKGLITQNCTVSDQIEFENSGRDYLGTKINFSSYQYTLVEGLGLIQNSENSVYHSDLLGLVVAAKTEYPSDEPMPNLYEVRNGTDEVIFRDDKYAPGWAKPAYTGIMNTSLAQNVWIKGDDISALIGNETDQVSVYNAQGQLIGCYKAVDGVVRFSIANYPKGVYVMNMGSMSAKFTK